MDIEISGNRNLVKEEAERLLFRCTKNICITDSHDSIMSNLALQWANKGY
jgi:hypothetical protein